MRHHFQEALDAVLLEAYRSGGPIVIADACALAWEIVTARYFLDHASEQHRARWRTMNNRDVRYALGALERLGALQRSDDTVTLTAPAMAAMRRASGDASPGDAVLQLKISLIGVTKPPVWRRLLVPAGTRLDRLHEIIQASMGWHDCHLHVFSAADAEYGLPDPELDHRDERRTTLDRLIAEPGDRMRYTYDFGGDWEHEILVEKVLSAEPGGRYPACVGGKSRCPPEDCGGAWGYSDLRETLADPGHPEHEAMLEWLGLENGSEFDPAAFDVDEVNAVLA